MPPCIYFLRADKRCIGNWETFCDVSRSAHTDQVSGRRGRRVGGTFARSLSGCDLVLARVASKHFDHCRRKSVWLLWCLVIFHLVSIMKLQVSVQYISVHGTSTSKNVGEICGGSKEKIARKQTARRFAPRRKKSLWLW